MVGGHLLILEAIGVNIAIPKVVIPQGGLFNLYHADDCTTISSGANINDIRTKITDHLVTINGLIQEHDLQLSPTKSTG